MTAPAAHFAGHVTCVHSSDEAELLDALAAEEYAVLHLDGGGVTGKAAFIARAMRDLPGPDDEPGANWDAFADWLWQAMSARVDDRVAIVWRDAHVLLEASLPVLLTAVQVVTDLAREADDAEHGFSHPMHLVLCLVGDGAMFPPFTPPAS